MTALVMTVVMASAVMSMRLSAVTLARAPIVVVAVLKTLRLDGRGVFIADEALVTHRQRFEAVLPDRRKQLCTDLLAAADYCATRDR